eukprot:Nitzschia sp. Nitz4//scaffold52_size167869//129898//130692//NITZ4_002290-RA/size167869-processed-gene-0.175-mRNA-1//-1//CDS//3329554077//9093//frame0
MIQQEREHMNVYNSQLCGNEADDDASYSDDDSCSDDGGMFARMKSRANAMQAKIERRNHKLKRGGNRRSPKGIKAFFQKEESDCFSVSSLEVDLKTDDDSGDDDLINETCRFQAKCKPNTQDMTPARPRSSGEEPHLQSSAGAVTSWSLHQNLPQDEDSSSDDEDKPLPPEANLLRDRWSSDSDKRLSARMEDLLPALTLSLHGITSDTILSPPVRGKVLSDAVSVDGGVPRSARWTKKNKNTRCRWQGEKTPADEGLRSPARY